MSEPFDFTSQPVSESCRRIDFHEAEIWPAEPPGTPTLVVRGQAPCQNMEVSLYPLVYIRCPEYWGIEVVGCLPGGICLTAIKDYEVTIDLSGIMGSEGIEVIGATKRKKFELEGGCEAQEGL